MRINLGEVFRPRAKTPSVAKAQVAATDIVTRVTMAETIKALPDGSYAILICMTPEEDGLMIRDFHFPQNRDSVTYHGLYNYAAEYLVHRIHSGD